MKKTVGVICGGYSGEAVISLKSADMIMGNIDRELYSPIKITISESSWLAHTDHGDVEIDKNDFSFKVNGVSHVPDICLIMVHGTPGEDGKLQGYFDLIGMPYTTGGVTNTSLTFNKILTTSVLRSLGFNTARGVLLSSIEELNVDEVISTVSLPCFVKPNEGGSSLGTSKVNDKDGLKDAVKLAFEKGNAVLIESFLAGRELSSSAIRTPSGVVTFELTEIITKKEFFDYAAKYDYDQTQEITPAEVSKELSDKCKAITRSVYEKMNCSGIIRIDYKLNGEEFSIIEINTVPGMSEKSIVPQQAEAAGVSKTELISMMLNCAKA
jgi:D-alanine-D-alanine ligase